MMPPRPEDCPVFSDVIHDKAPGRVIKCFSAKTIGREEPIMVYMDAPYADEECPIGMGPIAETEVPEAEGEVVPFEELPGASVAMLRCGHRFNAFTYFYHAMYSTMRCPVCRDGVKARMDPLSINRPWSHRFQTSVSLRTKQNTLENMAADERATEDAIHADNGMFPFTAELLFGDIPPFSPADDLFSGAPPVFQLFLESSTQNDAHVSQSQRQVFRPVTHPAINLPVDNSQTNTAPADQPHTFHLQPPVVTVDFRPVMNPAISLPGDDSQANTSLAAQPLTFQLQTPVVTVDMFASVYLYGPNGRMLPYMSMEFAMRRLYYNSNEQAIVFSINPHDTRVLSMQLEQGVATRFRVVVGYMRLLGGLERVAVSPEINVLRNSGMLHVPSVVGSGTFAFDFLDSIDGTPMPPGINGIRFISSQSL